ncbi:MAG: CP family cyanate transporter-like MFS transporter [Candidatus Azotimanducaceae bacterium]|jgi:CP family cyanate transporter-like MFS transporter
MLYVSFGLIAASLAPIASEVLSDLNMTHTEMGLAMGAWQFIYIFSAVPSGILLDRIGARYALTIGGFVVALSALARVFVDDATTLILAVMLFGLGGPIVSAGASKVVISVFTGSSRGLAMGIYMTGPAIGSIIALTTTHSVLLPYFDGSWRSILLLWSGIAFLTTFFWFGLATAANSSATGKQTGARVSQVQVIGELLSQPAVLIVLLMSVSVMMFGHGLNNWLPELLQSHGLSAVNAGYWAALPTVIGVMASLIIPRLATPERRFKVLIGLSLAAFLATVMLRFTEPSSMLTGLILQGIANSSLVTVLILTLLELPEVNERYAGVASGLFFSASQLGGVLGPFTLGLLYTPEVGFSSGLTLLTIISLTIVGGASMLQYRSHNAAIRANA